MATMRFGAVSARIYGLLHRRSPGNRIVVDLAELKSDDYALEVGCGPGTALALAAERIGADRVAAVDPSPTFVSMVRNRIPGADVRVAGAEDLPFDDDSFTVIWAIASMHHWTDRDAGLATLTAKLAPGGRLLLAERLLDVPGHGITTEQLGEVTAKLADLGHTDIRTVERRSKRRTIMIIRSHRP
jgi:SAM-dependent methyltransferase